MTSKRSCFVTLALTLVLGAGCAELPDVSTNTCGNGVLEPGEDCEVSKLDDQGNVIREIDVGAEICGHTFAKGSLYILRGQENPSEDWRIARLNPQEERPAVEDIAVVPFASRSLTFDGELFWSNYRAKDTIISFAVPN